VVWGVAAVLPGSAALRTLLALAATALALAVMLRLQAGLTAWGPLLLTTAALLLWLALSALVATLAAALHFVLTLLAGLRRNGWGLVSGHGTDEAARPQALTDWLVDYFDGLAGRDLQRRPLTFGDLWGLPEGPPLAQEPRQPPPREIDLRVMTTAVSQQLCYALPFRPGAIRFHYCREEWQALFPSRVMRWLDEVSATLDNPAAPVHDNKGRTLRRLPLNADLPVVVAVRMSLSFPVLLSAVPLYAIDRSLQVGDAAPPATKVWFSDGGIGSNMPLHFFDAPLPGRPTFAVNLKDEHPRHPIDPKKKAREQTGRVYLPANNNQGLQPQHWKEPPDGAAGGVFNFLAQIVNTMQNWRDQIQFPSPGYRDRIVQISQVKGEGGLNLNMPSLHIERLADAGEHAAEQLDQRFRVEDGWANHRRVRLRSFVALAEELVKSRSLQDASWDEVAESLKGDDYTEAERAMVLEVLGRLRGIGREFDERAVTLQDNAPRPLPQMRVTPRF
jgi:predicted acylesterase/phospholipase RssA